MLKLGRTQHFYSEPKSGNLASVPKGAESSRLSLLIIMKAVLFARVSSREQEETGYSLPSQEKLLKDYAKRRGFEIAKKFSISEAAGEKSQRIIFNEMVDYVKKNRIKIILCEKVDRLTRNLKDAVTMNNWLEEEADRQIHFVKPNLVLHRDSKSDDKFRWDIEIVLARKYLNNLSEEVKKGLKEKIAQGWLPTKPPFGYKTIGERGHKIHIPDEKTAHLVKRAFELYATGNYSLYKLAKAMSEEGSRSSLGNKITKSRWADLFSDPFYIGKIRWKGEIYEGQQKPLVSKELSSKVQDVLKSRATPKYRKHFSVFKSLMKCKNCDGRITWEQKKGHWYGHCNYYQFCDKRTYVREEKVENQLLSYLDKVEIKNSRLAEWIQRALKESHQDEIEYHQKNREELNSRYEQIQKRLDMIYDDKLDGKITPEFYKKKFEQYSEEKEAIVDSLKRHSEAQTAYFELGFNVLELSKRAKEIYSRASVEEKRMLLSFVFSNLRLDKENLIVSYAKPFEILSQRVAQLKGSKVAESLQMPAEILEPSFSEQKSPKRAVSAKWLPRCDSNYSFILYSKSCIFGSNPNRVF